MSTELLAAAALAASGQGQPVTARIEGVGAFTARGPDAGSFLHGQLAADVQGLKVGHAVRSLLLNHRGHALADAMVARDPGEWLVVVDDDMADWVGKTLAEHIIFDDVTLERVQAAATVTLQGKVAVAVLAVAVAAPVAAPTRAEDDLESPRDGGAFWRGRHLASGLDLVVYPRRRCEAGGYDLTLLGEDRDAVDAAAASLLSELEAAGAAPVTAAAIDAARIAAAITTAGRDAGVGVLPQEAGLTAGLSYRKGCYLGQEVMARIEARGNLKRGLATVEVVTPSADAAALLASHTTVGAVRGSEQSEAGMRDIELAGRKVGVLGTAASMPDGRVLALAVLRRDLAVGADLTAGGLHLRVAKQASD